jgi:hypothetical protein
LTRVILDKTFGSDTWKPGSGSHEQGPEVTAQGAKSTYQGANRKACCETCIVVLSKANKRAEPVIAKKNPFSPTDKVVVQHLVARLRRNMCTGCPWAAQRRGIETLPAPEPAAQDAMAAD